MATKPKSGSKAKTIKTAKTTRATAASARTTKKTPVKTTRTTTTKATTVAPVTKQTPTNRFESINASALVGEFIGTFLLVTAIMAFSGNAFFVGVSLIVIAIVLFAITGAHFNPAVSFGFWTMRRITALKMVTYWVAQFVGAMAALLAINLYANTGLAVSFSNFLSFDWKIFMAELIGMSVFMFGIAAAVNRGQTDVDKSVGIGLSLFLALAIGTGLLAQAAQNNIASGGEQISERITRVEGVTVNPAVALATNEASATAQQNPFAQSPEDQGDPETPATRLNLEVILGTLIGAALGGNLYLLLFRSREN